LGLRSTTADYKYSHNGTDFFLNICGGLVSPHLKCPMSSSACEIDKNKYPNGASLGDYHTMRFFHNKHMDQHVIVARFVNGTNGMSMTLEFFCDQTTIGSPVLQSTFRNGREYNFRWHTKCNIIYPNNSNVISSSIVLIIFLAINLFF